MAGAVFGDVGVSLFVVAFGDVAVALLAAGATFGDVGVSLFVAGAAFGEIRVDSRSTKCRIFLYKMRLQSLKSKLGEGGGARWPVHVRIMLGSFSHCPPL